MVVQKLALKKRVHLNAVVELGGNLTRKSRVVKVLNFLKNFLKNYSKMIFSIECEPEFYGVNCNQTCNCSLNSIRCDPILGCVCNAGFEGLFCENEIDGCEGNLFSEIDTKYKGTKVICTQFKDFILIVFIYKPDTLQSSNFIRLTLF